MQKLIESYRSTSVLFLGLFVLFLVSPLTSIFANELSGGIVKSETQQGYSFMSGGVGTDERNEMIQQSSQYDLALSFAAPAGNYLSDVQVVITDQRGNQVINTTTAGPLFYAQLPPGRYNVKATLNGQTQEIRNIQVSNAHRFSRLLHWNVPMDQIVER